jgi:hypothetical protein
MQTLTDNLPHMIMGFIAIVAVTLLSIEHVITGGEALAVIGASSGFTMAASASYMSQFTGGVNTPVRSLSLGQTVTETTTHQVSSSPRTGTSAQTPTAVQPPTVNP